MTLDDAMRAACDAVGIKAPPSPPACAVEGCQSPAGKRGWCPKHYQRWLKTGDPQKTRHAISGAPMQWLREVALKHAGDDCLTWPFGKSGGYGRIYASGRVTYAHRVICEAIHGPAPQKKMDVAHSCGRGHLGCVSPGHLSWKTRAANQADRLRHGTHHRGEQHPLAKLTEDQVREIRKLSETQSFGAVGRRFGVAAATVSSIAKGNNWGWME